MSSIARVTAIAVVFVSACVAWMILAGITGARSRDRESALGAEVHDLWGHPHRQEAPTTTFQWTTTRVETKSHYDTKTQRLVEIRETVTEPHTKDVAFASNVLRVDLHLDQRLKGLVWYSLYDVGFEGAWTYVHEEPLPGTLRVAFQFPDATGVYDDFRFIVAGKNRAHELRPVDGQVSVEVPVSPGEELAFAIGYASRGLDTWTYAPARGVGSLRNFRFTMNTDFPAIDFPSNSMSPSEKTRTETGWTLAWNFRQIITGHDIGMSMPAPIQPGELATALALSAPVSLFFFFLVIFALATLRGLDVHPMNYLFIAGAFFAFHLLFAYSVDHLRVAPAFALSSVVSVVLVVTYLRLVVGTRFAFVEAALAQLIYLVGFSLAHFWTGFTGLTVTVLSIVTLFLLMQLTGRVRWGAPPSQPEASPAGAGAPRDPGLGASSA